MMTWEIILGIFSLVAFLISIGGLVWKLAAVISRLDEAVKDLKKYIEEQSDKNRTFYNRLDNHEIRITKLEVQDIGKITV